MFTFQGLIIFIIYLIPLSLKIWATLTLPRKFREGEIDKSGLTYTIVHSAIFILIGITLFIAYLNKKPINLVIIIMGLIYLIAGIWGIIEVRKYHKQEKGD